MKNHRTVLLFSRLAVVGASLALFPACQNNEITSTWVPKEESFQKPASADMNMMGMPEMAGSSHGHREVDWTVPKSWVEKSLSTMRVGSFTFKGSNGMEVDISVVPLSGPAGGDLANINRWRGQINLPSISEKEFKEKSRSAEYNGRRMLLIDYTSKEKMIDDQYKSRVVAAIHKHGGQSWFFKMTGEESAVQEAKPSFREFLKSLRFHDH